METPSKLGAMNVLGQLQSVDPINLKDFIIIAGVFLSNAAAIAALLRAGKTQKREVSFSEQLVTKEFCTSSHQAQDRRIESVEKQATDLWNTVRSENAKIRAEISKGFQDIERAIGRIEGRFAGKGGHRGEG